MSTKRKINKQTISSEKEYSPEADDLEYTFKDLFDLDEIQKLQDAFSAATGVASIITEPDGTPITKSSLFSCLCEKVIRKTPKGFKNCMLSDSIVGSPNKNGPRIQKCLSAGLLDGGASIMVGDKHIANWLIGQVMVAEADIEKMMQYADEIEADKEAYVEALKKITVMSKEQFIKIADFLFLNAHHLSVLAVKNAEQKAEIQRRIRIEKQLAEEKELFRVTIQSIGDAVITTDVQGRITTLNTVAENLTGWTQSEAIGVPLEKVFRIINEKTCKKCQNPVAKVLKTGRQVMLVNHTVLISRDSTKRSIVDSGAPIKDSAGNIYGVVLVFRDVTEEKRQQEKILHLSYHDKLTGIYNRVFFEKELGRLERDGEFPISIIMGDVNGLKITNDIFGHAEGDKLLKTISKILKKSCRAHDIIARWGGDEFSIILPKTDYQTALNICNTIKMTCNDFKNNTVDPSIALGLDTQEDASHSLITVIKKAEDRMYRNKLFESKSKQSGTAASLQRTLFEKSYETEEHALRLIDISQKIGRALGLHENDLDDLQLLASLHDIGKGAISDTILAKPGKLTEDEWEEMKRHSEIGYRITKSALELSHISEYILCHHERWDGTGYPQGRKGEEIPLLSRIISIADSYDVMTNIRSYKNKMTVEQSLKEIRRCSGTQFDPALVELFLMLMSPKE